MSYDIVRFVNRRYIRNFMYLFQRATYLRESFNISPYFLLFNSYQAFSLHWSKGAKWLRGRVLDSRLRDQASLASLGCGPRARHIYPSLVLVQPRKTCPCLNERLLMGRKESNQTKLHWSKIVSIQMANYLSFNYLYRHIYQSPLI